MKKVNSYALLDIIGHGSSAKVYLAVDTEKNRPSAAKSISLSSKNNASVVRREIRLLRRLHHPNLVALHEVLQGTTNQRVYIFLEWAPYGSLADHLWGPVPEPTIARIFSHICDALSYLHGEGIAHHDVKPANILLFPNGVAKLTDFGISQSFGSVDAGIGSPGYQAPEYFDDEVELVLDATKQDVWSLGVSIYEAAFGRLPFKGGNVFEVAHDIVGAPLVIPDTASGALRDLLTRMLDRSPETRLTLEEVKRHRFFDVMAESFEMPIEPRTIPDIAGRGFTFIAADVCDENSIVPAPMKPRSWPGLYRRYELY